MQRNEPAALARWKIWLFRLLAMVLAPLLFVALLEMALRLAGYGYPTAFLLPAKHQGRDVLVPNNQFGWRFFGRELARLPEPMLIAREKPPQTIRIFFLGESAAKGEPQPAFGPARMLRVLLSQRYPDANFEVVNVAMTAINSHAILPIARDCARADGDVWVIYMGNNEVVGPFGAGTVFGHQSPPRFAIRATLALKATRTGQLLEGLVHPGGRSDEVEWGGMAMFLQQQVTAADERLKAVYEHFESNLNDIIRLGRNRGVRLVVSTVAVNLRDCPPFASAHRPGLTDEQRRNWEAAFARGVEDQTAGRLDAAAGHYAAAARIDDTFAELRFRQGQCAVERNDGQEARKHFAAARDFDTLRFRCDSTLNEIIRRTVRDQGGAVRLADSEHVFAAGSPEGLPGAELFYEHVHPTFTGNYRLALTLAQEVEQFLPPGLAAKPAWATEAEVAQHLGWSDWSQFAVWQDVLARIKGPPFTGQVNHDSAVRRVTAQLDKLAFARQPTGVADARARVSQALQTSPDDAVLHGQLAALLDASGDLPGAIAAVRRGLELVPHNAQAWQQLGLLLIRQPDLPEAINAFARAAELDPADAVVRQNLAQALWLAGQRPEALAEYRQAVELQPNLTVAWLGLGSGLRDSGKPEEAEECFRRAFSSRSSRAADHVALARFCRSRGLRDAAATNYSAALSVSPTDGSLHLEAGQNLLALQRHAEAFRVLGDAVRLAPNSAQARNLYGSLLGQQRRPVEAEEQFRAALAIDPAHLEARLNLGIALMSQGRNPEARACLEEVLQRSPTNELAQKSLERLRADPGAP